MSGLVGLLGCAGAKVPPPATLKPTLSVGPTAPNAPNASVANAPRILPEDFSPSGDHVVYLRNDVPTVAALADCSVVATVSSELLSRNPEGLSLRLPSDDTLLVTHGTRDDHNNETRVEELRALPQGKVVSQGPSFDWFETPRGRVRFELQQGDADEALSISAVLRPPRGVEERFDVKRAFGEGPRIELRPLAAVGDSLIISRHVGAAVSYDQIGVLNLKTGAARQLGTPIGVMGQAVVNGNRLALVQEDDSPAFVYELPSLRRVATARLVNDATEQTLETLSIGRPNSCVALSPSNDVLALWQRSSLAWFSARDGRLLGRVSEDNYSFGGEGLGYDCRLTFKGDNRLVLAGGRGSVSVVDTNDRKEVVNHDWLNCRRVGNHENCYAYSALSPNARFFSADNVVDRDGQRLAGLPHGYLVDLETDVSYDLGPLQPQQLESEPPTFDPSSRYVVRGGQVFSTSPFKHLCDLPR